MERKYEGGKVITFSGIRQKLSADNTLWGSVPKECIFGEIPGYSSGTYSGIRIDNEPGQKMMSSSTEDENIMVHYAFTPDFRKMKITFEAMNDVWLKNGNKTVSYLFLEGKPAIGETMSLDYWERSINRKGDKEVENHFSDVFSGTRKFFTGLENEGIKIPEIITE